MAPSYGARSFWETRPLMPWTVAPRVYCRLLGTNPDWDMRIGNDKSAYRKRSARTLTHPLEYSRMAVKTVSCEEYVLPASGSRPEKKYRVMSSALMVLRPSNSCSIIPVWNVCKPSNGNPHQGFIGQSVISWGGTRGYCVGRPWKGIRALLSCLTITDSVADVNANGERTGMEASRN
jgi:hypothetical protein